MGENFPDIELGNDFLDITPDMQATKQIDKWTTVTKMCGARKEINHNPPIECEVIFLNHRPNKELISKRY